MKYIISNIWRELLVVAAVLWSVCIFAKEYRIKVAIIDSGIRDISSFKPYQCEDGNIDMTNMGIYDINGHGTNVAGLVTSGIDSDRFCIIIIKWFHSDEYNNANIKNSIVGVAIKRAINSGAKFINLSLAGAYSDSDEYNQIKRGLANGIVFTVASGNNGLDLSSDCSIFPACYGFNNINYRVISAIDLLRANRNGPVTNTSQGNNQCGFDICLTGTSQATAVFLNSILKEYSPNLELRKIDNSPAITYGVDW